jgi:hypothetical protein
LVYEREKGASHVPIVVVLLEAEKGINEKGFAEFSGDFD